MKFPTTIKCPNCKAEIPTSENLEIYGQAQVTGQGSIAQFYTLGIQWDAHDSEHEAFDCPKCGNCIKLNQELITS
jgi:predicted aldo/keto reductase-like oxidoreductase